MAAAPSRSGLNRLRKKIGVTLRALAPLCGMSPSLLSRIETGSVHTSANVMQRIHGVLQDIDRVKQAHSGFPLDLRDVAWLRREIRRQQSNRISSSK